MKPWIREFVLGLLLLAAILPAAATAADPAEQILLNKANFWRLKDRPDLAIEALKQLLILNPNQPDALYQYGMLEVQQGHISEAQRYLTRLRAVAPASPHVADLANAVRAGQVSKGDIAEARRLAKSGQFSQAARKYQQTFRGPPPTTFGVEYYLTLAGTAQGWDEARRGLERLAQTEPNNPKIKLALGQVLTYRDTTRYEGIQSLARLSRDPIVGSQALQAWRQALMWLGYSQRDRQLYDEYLAQHPQDAQVQQHLADAARGVAVGGKPGDVQRAAGYADLRRGNIGAAEHAFEADLRLHPGDPDALAGLGVIRLRQQRFGAARDLLGRAMRAAPGRRGQWAAAYESASFWAGLQAAKAARDAGNYQRARRLLTGLIGRGRGDAWNAELVLADVDAKLGDHASAEQAYRRVLAVRPRNTDAAVGLFNELTAQGKTAAAQALADRLPAGRLGGASRLRAEVLRTDAKASEARGDTAEALSKFQQAIAADPTDPWVRLDFARFLARQGELAQARVVIDPVASGNTAVSWYTAAIFDSEQNRFADALAKIDHIPPRSRTADIKAFRERILMTAEIERAKQLARAGNRGEARNILISLYSRPPVTAEKARLIADALSDIGETQAALQIARQSVGRAGPGSVRATIDYAGLLLRTGRDAEAAGYLQQLSASGHLSADDRRELEQLKARVAAARADRLRQRGDYADAYDQVSGLLAAYPNDPTLLLATGRIYAAAGQNNEAMRFFDAAYRQSPGDINVIRGAVGGAIEAGDLARARAYLAHGMQLYPNNPRLYFLRAEIARASGDNGAAMRALQTARALNQQQAGGITEPGAAPGTPGTLPPNPFRSSDASAPAAAPPVTAGSAAAAPAAMPAPVEVAAIPADSDDLTVPPHAAERPGRSGGAALAAIAGGAAGEPQMAQAMVADSDLGNLPPVAAQPQLAQYQGAQIQPLPPPPVPGYQPPPFAHVAAAPAPQDSLELDIQRSMAAIQAETNPMMQGGLALRWRDGEKGLSQLTQVGVPIEGSFSPFYTGTLHLSATPTYITAGTPSTIALPRFGSDPLLLASVGPNATLPAAGDQNAGGVGFSVAYSYRNFGAEIGTTPLGFPVENLIGHLALAWPGPAGNQPAIGYSNSYSSAVPPPIPLVPKGSANPLQIKVEASRRPITDSVLSYAGTKDPLSGVTWGGVVRTGGEGLISYDDGEIGVYAGGGGGTVGGKNVADNTEFDGVVGGFIRPYRSGDDSFKIGVNLTYFTYDKNLRFFTLGQGGYFSPQNYLNFGIPMEYSGRDGRFGYLIGGALGVQTFNEKQSPYFPNNPADQAALEAVPGTTAFYSSRSVTGPSFGLRGQLEYQLNNGFSVGGLATIDNAEDYTEAVAKLYLRKVFGVSPPVPTFPATRPGTL
jgi:cellulose synthase operon protein C